MIQRKQTLWLFLAALAGVGLFFFDLYKGEIHNGDTVKQEVLRVADNYPLLLLSLVVTVFPLVIIFFFRNRKRQMRMTAVCMVAEMVFLFQVMSKITNLSKLTPPVTNGSYWIGSILPAVAIVFLALALFGIRKDEKLVRSTDRLR